MKGKNMRFLINKFKVNHKTAVGLFKDCVMNEYEVDRAYWRRGYCRTELYAYYSEDDNKNIAQLAVFKQPFQCERIDVGLEVEIEADNVEEAIDKFKTINYVASWKEEKLVQRDNVANIQIVEAKPMYLKDGKLFEQKIKPLDNIMSELLDFSNSNNDALLIDLYSNYKIFITSVIDNQEQHLSISLRRNNVNMEIKSATCKCDDLMELRDVATAMRSYAMRDVIGMKGEK